jgi:hypothetical protein
MRSDSRGFVRPIGAAAAAVLLSLVAALATAVPASTATWTGPPFGHFDTAQGRGPGGYIDITGWAIDPDTTAPIDVWVTVDGVGQHLRADVNRPDVAAAYGFGANHGFAGSIPAPPGPHRVCVTASNVGPGAHTPLGCRTVTVPLVGVPFGNFERALGVPGGIEVAGWAIDPDTTAPIYVWVTVDGVGRHLYANGNRPDVGAAYPAFGPGHGFAGVVPASPGPHRVCVTASNVAHGAHGLLGCRTVTVPAVCVPFGSTEPAGSASAPGEQLSTIVGTTMRVGRNPCFDRFVFEFHGDGGIPGWSAEYTDVLRNDQTGEPIAPALRGAAFIDLYFGAWFTGEPLGEPPYAGPSQLLPTGFPALREARILGAFESVSRVGIGVDQERPLRGFWLTGPPRLVIDVYTGVP